MIVYYVIYSFSTVISNDLEEDCQNIIIPKGCLENNDNNISYKLLYKRKRFLQYVKHKNMRDVYVATGIATDRYPGKFQRRLRVE